MAEFGCPMFPRRSQRAGVLVFSEVVKNRFDEIFADFGYLPGG